MVIYSERVRAARRNRRYLTLVALVALLAVGWIALWFYASGKAEETIAGWRAREAQAGRLFTCGQQTMGGFPFRIEVFCERAGALFREARPPFEVKAPQILIAAQIYQPNLLISEFAAPLTIGEPGQPPAITAKWSLAQTSVRGTPAAPERVSIVLENPALDRTSPAEALLRGRRLELHGRLAEGSVARAPVIEVVLRSEKVTAAALGAFGTAPIDSDVSFVLRGLNDFSPKPWPQRFREIQAANGRIDITKARIQQGDTIGVGNGTLTINPRGRLEGQLNLQVAGVEALINKVLAATGQRGGVGLTLGLGLLGGNAVVEGKPAITLPLRFDDGVVRLGPLRVAEVPPLF
ncbi:MAG: DUF2125 domain-containing protein [Pseudolabrys sp.]|nr:DUF2125 domain-containing protein [Pseudolabrys sp.]MBV9954919.1 DUF2125 domain-containing protein [Pseudolabrys sp.]